MKWPTRFLVPGAALCISKTYGDRQHLGSPAPVSLNLHKGGSVRRACENCQPLYKLQTQGDVRGPIFNSFSSSMAAGKSNPATLLSWLGIRAKKMPVLLTYLVSVMLLTLLRKQTVALVAEITWILKGREREIKHMTAINFPQVLNLVTKPTVPRGSLMSAKEG